MILSFVSCLVLFEESQIPRYWDFFATGLIHSTLALSNVIEQLDNDTEELNTISLHFLWLMSKRS